MTRIRMGRLGALMVAFTLPASLSAQSDLHDPVLLAFQALDTFEQTGDVQFAVRHLLPCGPGNATGGRVLLGLLERQWTQSREDDIASAFGRVPWTECPDTRIDEWLRQRLLLRLGERSNYEPFWQALSRREAPGRMGLWRGIAEDESLSGGVRSRALGELGGLP